MKTFVLLLLVASAVLAKPNRSWSSSSSDSSSSSSSSESRERWSVKRKASYGGVRGFIDSLPADIRASLEDVERQAPVERQQVGGLMSGDVRFFLYTQQKPSATEIVDGNTHLINTGKPIIYIVPGWLQKPTTRWVIDMKDAYLSSYDYNVMVVDWTNPAFNVYPKSVSYTRPVGEYIARHMIRAQLPVDKIHVIGFCLGGQIAGFIGKTVKKDLVSTRLYRISALDPSGPGFQEYSYPPSEKLQKDDAVFVSVTHTDSNTWGTTDFVGHVDFFPMGGQRRQPGCPGADLEDSVNCSHTRSVYLFIESVNSKNFVATECDSWSKYQQGSCTSGRKVAFGELTDNGTRGRFFFRTNGQSPFARGD